MYVNINLQQPVSSCCIFRFRLFYRVFGFELFTSITLESQCRYASAMLRQLHIANTPTYSTMLALHNYRTAYLLTLILTAVSKKFVSMRYFVELLCIHATLLAQTWLRRCHIGVLTAPRKLRAKIHCIYETILLLGGLSWPHEALHRERAAVCRRP